MFSPAAVQKHLCPVCPPHLLPNPIYWLFLLNLCWVETGGTHAHASLIWWTTVSGSAQKVLPSFCLVHLSWTESERQWKHSSLCSVTEYRVPQRSLSRWRHPAITPHWRLYLFQSCNVRLNVLLISRCAECVMRLSCSLERLLQYSASLIKVSERSLAVAVS